MPRSSSSRASRAIVSAINNVVPTTRRLGALPPAAGIRPLLEQLESRTLLSVNVSTYHYDNARDGANTHETILTTSNVNTSTFGKVASFPVDGQIYAQPLVETGVPIAGQGTHDIVLVATENDSVYAFDAEGNNPAQGYLWKTSLLQTGETPIPESDYGTTDITPIIGITGTPVVDPTTNTLYVVGAFKESNGTYQQRLYALDITSGATKFGGPVTIAASVPGTGYDSVGGVETFNTFRENQRPALTLANGQVYVGWSSHGDQNPWHGWLIAYNASTLAQDYVYCTTANGEQGGIWMSGGGISVDASGNLYFSTGNGTFDANTGGADYSMAIVKMTPSLGVEDYFSPYNEATLSNGDLDYGCSSVILLPTQTGSFPDEILSAGKWGTVYLNDSDTGKMGEFTANGPNNDLGQANITTNVTVPNLHNTIAYWNGNAYVGGDNLKLQAFSVSGGTLGTTPSSESSNVFGTGGLDGQGCNPTISSNGNTNGIVWAVDNSGFNSSPAVLYAYNASNLSDLLWSSNQAANGRDTCGDAVKFQDAVVANGYVYVGGANSVTVYGLLKSPSKTVTSVPLSSYYNQQGITADGTTFSQTGGADGGGYAYSGTILGTSQSWNGESFTIGATGANDDVKAAGQIITLPQGNYTSIDMLASGVNGAQANQTFTITYTDGTTTTDTQGLSDWFNGASQTGESNAATMAYRNKYDGTKDSRTFYAYGYSLAVNSTKTVKSITLPNNGDVIVLSMNEVSPIRSTTSKSVTSVSLSSSYNVQGIYNDGSTYSMTGGLDGGGSSYSANLLGTSQTWNGENFTIGAAGANNVVKTTGQTITLTQGSYNSIDLLGTAVGATQAAQTFTITYTDNSTTTDTQAFSDWYYPAFEPGESTVLTMPYRNLSTGVKDNRPFNLYGYSLPVNASKTVKSITLPNDADVMILSMDQVRAATQMSLSNSFNKQGIYADGSTFSSTGGIDGDGDALSSTLLGTSDSYNGNAITIGANGAPNVLAGTGQVIGLTQNSYSTLSFLGLATNGSQASQTFTVTYTDGTTTTFTQGISDWHNSQGYAGESKVISMTYRNVYNGTKQTNTSNPWYVYGYTFTLNSAKTVKSITLPNNINVNILGIDLT